MKQPVSLIALDMDGTLNGRNGLKGGSGTPFMAPPAEFTLPYRPDALTPGFPSHFYPVSASPMPSPPTVLPSIICRIASASMNLRWSLRSSCRRRTAKKEHPYGCFYQWRRLRPFLLRKITWTCPHQSNATFTGPEPSPMISLPISASTI